MTTIALANLPERFRSKVSVNEDTGCWEWTASTHPSGYGRYYLPGGNVNAHRYSYEQLVGVIPDGLQVDHLCRVRNCVNPAHLEPVTCRENLLRGETFTARNAAKTHCPAGHEYQDDNVVMSARGQRHCRTCRAERYEQERIANGYGVRNSAKTHCPAGHPYDDTVKYAGSRYCRTCNRERMRERRARRKSAHRDG